MVEREGSTNIPEIEIPNIEQESQYSGPQDVLEHLLIKNKEELKSCLPEYAIFSNHVQNGNRMIMRNSELTEQMLDRSKDAIGQVEQRINEVRSQITVSVAYTQMLNELKDKCTPEEIFDFFKKCLSLNDRNIKIATEDPQMHIMKLMLKKEAPIPSMEKDIQKYIGSRPPSWFKGESSEWIAFAFHHAHFEFYANQEYFEVRGGMMVRKANVPNEALRGITIEDGRPEWMNEDGNSLPTEDEVRLELEEDERELQSLRNVKTEMGENRKNVQDLFKKRWIKSYSYFEQRRRNLESGNTNIFKTLFYLWATKESLEFPNVDLDSESEDVEHDMRKSIQEPERSQERIIEKFASEGWLTKEVLALWIEDKMRAAKLGTDMQTVTNSISFLISEPTSADFYALKEQDKAYHNFLKHDLNPFFSLLSKNEKEYLEELLPLSSSSFELLEEVSEIFSDNLKNKAEVPMNIAQDMKKFIARFLKKNREREAVSGIISILFDKQTNLVDQPMVAEDVEIKDMQQELEEQEEEARNTSLSNWNLHLVSDYNIEHESSALKGTTSEGLIESLDRSLHENNIDASIKTSSIVHALEWFVAMPESVRHLWMKQEIDGTTYYKIKRGPVRIFCHIDEKTRKISFFPYQKKSMSYHFFR